MKRLAFALAAWATTPIAAAHELGGAAAASLWNFDPWIVVPLVLVGLGYALGWARIAARTGTTTSQRRGSALTFAAGWLLLAIALLSPLHGLGERLFSFHMIEHELVMAAAAPLFVLARPIGPLLWSLPHPGRRALGGAMLAPALAGSWRWLTRPLVATVLHGAAIWLWHVPGWFEAALAAPPLHRLQHLSFFLTALLFWWAMLRRAEPGRAIWHLFMTMLHTSVLGALLTLAPRVLYRLQTADAPAWGLSPLEDQQLAGLLMWIPAQTVYAGAALALAATWIRRSRLGELRVDGAVARS